MTHHINKLEFMVNILTRIIRNEKTIEVTQSIYDDLHRNFDADNELDVRHDTKHKKTIKDAQNEIIRLKSLYNENLKSLPELKWIKY